MPRTVGAKNKHTRKRELQVLEAAGEIEKTLAKAFKGDSHALLMTVYKDEDRPIELRVDAAKTAIRYEKPALSSVDAHHSGQIDIRAFLQSLGEPD